MARLITRFAPSPTGQLHLGHAFSAITAFDLAQRHGGAFLLRLEDIDKARCRPEFEAQIFDDLLWLGLSWPDRVMRQSSRMGAYADALSVLDARSLTYRCTCTRADILSALSAPQEGAAIPGPDGPVYPGTCRDQRRVEENAAIRLHMARATSLTDAIGFRDSGPIHAGHHQYSPKSLTERYGDVVLARRDIGASYHLAVCVDDAAQGVTHVVRGEDLFEATAIHTVLQNLLSLPTPDYVHHALIRDPQGRRLAKRDDARALSKFRSEGASPADIRALIGL